MLPNVEFVAAVALRRSTSQSMPHTHASNLCCTPMPHSHTPPYRVWIERCPIRAQSGVGMASRDKQRVHASTGSFRACLDIECGCTLPFQFTTSHFQTIHALPQCLDRHPVGHEHMGGAGPRASHYMLLKSKYPTRWVCVGYFM